MKMLPESFEPIDNDFFFKFTHSIENILITKKIPLEDILLIIKLNLAITHKILSIHPTD